MFCCNQAMTSLLISSLGLLESVSWLVVFLAFLPTVY